MQKTKFNELATFEKNIVFPFTHESLYALINKIEKKSKELKDDTLTDFTDSSTRTTKPLSEGECALILKELMTSDAENKDKHLEIMLNPSVSEQRTYIKANWNKVSAEIKNWDSYNASLSLPNLDIKSEITFEKFSANKLRQIVLKLADLV